MIDRCIVFRRVCSSIRRIIMSRTATAHHGQQSHTNDNNNNDNVRSSDLRESPMMARLLDALEKKVDIGHYGQFTFVTVARHFIDEDEIVRLLTNQPDMDEEKA